MFTPVTQSWVKFDPSLLGGHLVGSSVWKFVTKKKNEFHDSFVDVEQLHPKCCLHHDTTLVLAGADIKISSRAQSSIILGIQSHCLVQTSRHWFDPNLESDVVFDQTDLRASTSNPNQSPTEPSSF